MAQYEIELILLRQVASYLATPIFLVDLDGTLLYYNEPAELILGRRYEETGEMPMSEWSTIFVPTDAEGNELPPDDLPLVQAVMHGLPAHSSFWITGLDGERRGITVTALPVIGQERRPLGALALFWQGDT